MFNFAVAKVFNQNWFFFVDCKLIVLIFTHPVEQENISLDIPLINISFEPLSKNVWRLEYSE